MKRLHVSFGVSDLEKSVAFYSTLFGAPPSVRRPGYAKWQLEDPRVNFVVETQTGQRGFGHAGIQVDTSEELEPIFERLKAAEAPYLPEGVTTCCYHKSEKSWTRDPDGIRWEAFHTLHQMETFGTGPLTETLEASAPNTSSCGCAESDTDAAPATARACCR